MAFWDNWFKREPQQAPTIATDGEVSDITFNALSLAESIYRGSPPWLSEEQPPMRTTGLGALFSAEISRLVTIECKVLVENTRNADQLNHLLQKYVMNNLRAEIEKGWALGGLILKPYYTKADLILKDENQVTAINGNLKVGFYYPSQFNINKYDNSGVVTDICFYTTIKQDGDFYTLKEQQVYDEETNTLYITNKVFKTSSEPAKYRWDNLGNVVIPLTVVPQWADMLASLTFSQVSSTLLGFYKPAGANNLNVMSPYGLSPLVRASESLRRADIIYNSLDWETESSLSRLYIDSRAITSERDVPAKVSKHMIKLIGMEQDRLFEKFSPTIRDESYLNVYNSHLRQCEDIIGLAHGTVSDVNMVDKTATEYLMSRQRTYATVTDNQRALETAIRQLVYAMNVWLSPKDTDEDIQMSFDFDDSIVSNPKEQVETMLLLQGAGNIPAYKVNMSYFNITKEEALLLVEEANKTTWEDIE